MLDATGEAAEEAVGLPLRACAGVGDALDQIQNDLVELRRGGFVHGLIQIVGRSVITILQPILVQLFLGRPGQISELERQRRNALADETVLIAADEQIALRLLVGLHLDAGLRRPPREYRRPASIPPVPAPRYSAARAAAGTCPD